MLSDGIRRTTASKRRTTRFFPLATVRVIKFYLRNPDTAWLYVKLVRPRHALGGALYHG